MQTREPFFENEVNSKKPFLPSPTDLKIPVSIEHGKLVQIELPALKGSSRRGSMEPYFQQRHYSHQSSSNSSYARLSDVFDYNYLDTFRIMGNENAIASDSDTDYDDDDNDTAKCPIVLGRRSRGSFTDSASDLEDYSVHLLTFKVNSAAQYTRPPSNNTISATDQFDSLPTPTQLTFLSTSQHPVIKSAFVPKCGFASMFEQPEVEMETYLQACENPIACLRVTDTGNSIQTVPFKNSFVSDCYISNFAKSSISDKYEGNHTTPTFL